MNKTFAFLATSCAVVSLALTLSTQPAQARTHTTNPIRAAQLRLVQLGYPVGRVDGVMGAATENALMDFQRSNNLPVTGELTPSTYSMLTQNIRIGTGNGPGAYASYENYYRQAADGGMGFGAAAPVVDRPAFAWGRRWDYAHDQELPSRYASLNVKEEDEGAVRHYVITVNGQPVLFADNQPGVMRASRTYSLYNEDAVIFTVYTGDTDCPNKSYLLSVHSDSSFNRPIEIGNCSASYDVKSSSTALLVNFKETGFASMWQSWNTWQYQNSRVSKI
jgi:peptidoglycan hydrolase-like protein with peptidoglycan-binding domain